MKSPELTEFFSLLGKAKKEKKEEFDNLLKEADINLDVLTSSVVTGIKEAKVNIKKQKKKEKKLIEQLDSIIDVIENPKEVKDITEPAVTVGVPEDFDISTLEIEDVDDNPSFEIVDVIKPEPIKTPKISDTVAQAIKFIEETNIKEEIENSDETSIDDLKGEIKQVRDILYKVLSHGPGSGEVNLLKLDDVDEDTAKVDGKFLKYDSSSGKFTGASAGIGTQDSLNTSGIITASQFSGYSHLIAPYGSTTTITVKVATKTSAHRYSGQGSSNGYVLDNVEAPFLTLTPGRTYRFDVSDSSNSGHPFRFYYDADKTTQYTTGVSVTSNYVDLEVTDTTPTVLHYQCSSHGNMGNSIQVNSNVVDTPSGGTIRGTLTATAFSGPLTGNVTGNLTGDVTGDLTGDVTGDITSSGNSQFTNRLQLKSTDGTPARLDFYCESSNAHYLRLQAPPHSQFSGNPTVVLPNSAGTLLLSDGDGSALTGIAVTDNIRTNTNATFLQNVNVSGTVTATNFLGGGANITSINASNISSGTIGAARIPTLNQNTTGTSAGLTGTPNITVGSIIASTGTFSGNVTIGGTLTYEDVTNIDSVGLVTARSGLIVGTGVTLSKDGDGFYTGIVTATTFVGNVTGNVSGSSGSTTGNAATATKLATARAIAGQSFDGTADITIDYGNIQNTPTIPSNNNQLTNGAGYITSSGTAALSQGLTGTPSIVVGVSTATKSHVGVDTGVYGEELVVTGDARVTGILTIGTGSITLDPTAKQLRGLEEIVIGIANTITIKQDAKGEIEFTDAVGTPKSVGIGTTVSINTSGIITATTFVGALTGNVTGDASGNAGTATKLATARTIGGVSFDGSANINLPGVNSDGNQDTTGNAATSTLAVSAQGLTGSPNITVTDVNAVDAIISGNLSVAGTITSLDQNDILATGIITASSGVDLGDPGIVTLSSNTLTTTSTSTDTVASVSATVNRSATFQVQVTRGTQYHMTTINMIHDGTQAFISEYGTIRTGQLLATFSADISGGNLRLRVTPTSSASTVFKLSKTTIKV